MVEHLKNLVLAIAICIFLSWGLDRDPPHDYGQVTVLSSGLYQSGRPVPPAMPGGSLTVRFEFSRERLCPMRIERSFVDAEGALFILPEERYTPTELGEVILARHIEIDGRANPGAATAKFDLFWYCNPVHRLANMPIHSTILVPFTIVSRPGG